MDQLETGKDKIKKICDLLKNETLDPARQEAQTIIQKAEEKARVLIHDAEEKGKELINQAQKKIEDERKVFETNLQAACKQGVETLRQEIENKLFNDELVDWIEKHTVDPKLQGEIAGAVVAALEKEGTSADFSAYIGKGIEKEAFMSAVGDAFLKKVKGVEAREFVGGVQLKLHDKRLTLDVSDHALIELISKYIRKDFRKLLFTEK